MSHYDDTPWRDEQTLRELYHGEGMNGYEVADELDCGQSTVLEWMNKLGVEPRDPPVDKGATSISVDEQGYERIWDGNKYIRLHRLLAVSQYGFEASKDADVHHKNEIPWDNRPENIEVLSHKEHTLTHRPWE